MPKRLPSLLISAAAGAACLALATPAWAAAADPPGANGTVKIDGVPLDDGIDNEPHVGCEFSVDFFNFDEGQRATIVFAAHPPTDSGTELLRRDVVVSNDPAGGGKPDPDETFPFSATELGLDAFTPQKNQGFHVKLTVELEGLHATKHKVFWLEPCETGPSTPPSTPGTPPGGGGNGGGGNGGGNGGGLPVTGVAVGSIALLGGGMVAGGIALLFIRRRRDVTLEN